MISYNAKTLQNNKEKFVNLVFNKDKNKFDIKGSSYSGEASINNPSPKPNNIKPKQQKNNVENFGLKLYISLELQFTFGIFLIFKNIF